MFKKGDRIRRINRSAIGIPVGTTVTVLEDQWQHYNVLITDLFNKVRILSTKNFELVTDVPRDNKTTKENNNKMKYSFRSPMELIDGAMIVKELSYKNPIAIVRADDSTGCILIHQSIQIKADLCGIPEPDAVTYFTKESLDIIGTTKSTVEYIKRCPYPRGVKTQKITVEILEVV